MAHPPGAEKYVPVKVAIVNGIRIEKGPCRICGKPIVGFYRLPDPVWTWREDPDGTYRMYHTDCLDKQPKP